MSTRIKYVNGGVVVLVGLLAATVPAWDMAEDVLVGGKSPASTLIENSPLLVLSLGIVACGVWLAVSDVESSYVRTVTNVTLVNAAGVAALIGLVVLVQMQLQSDLKPFVIAADAVVIGTLGGVVLGIRTAQQEQATDEAAAQRDRFQALFDNVPNPIVGVEFVEGIPIVRAVNPAFTEVFGFDRRTILDENLEEFVVPPEESLDPVEQPATPEDVASADAWDTNVIELETVDGHREFIRLTAPVERGPARDSYAIYIDVTVQRQRRERLRVLSRTLRHDIRNQLTIIKPCAEELAGALSGELAERARFIQGAAEEILRMSEQTRRVEEQIAGESEPGSRDLVAMVREAAATVREEHDCTVTVEAPETAYGNTTSAFPVAVQAVIENGVEHNDRDEPAVEVSIVETLEGEYYDVRVADDGPGIPEDQVDVVSGTSEHTQTKHLEGLGLWTARWVLQNSGGDLTFSANAPRGTVVTLRVPRATPPETGDEAAAA